MGVAVMGLRQRFLGKPKGVLRLIPGRYVRLDGSRFVGTAGSQDVLAYLHIDYTLDDPAMPGRVRYRVVREAFKGAPADPSAFKDIPLLPGFSDWLETIVWWEQGQKGRPLHVELRVEKATATVACRYTKHRTIT
jgi:hypothetical protein